MLDDRQGTDSHKASGASGVLPSRRRTWSSSRALCSLRHTLPLPPHTGSHQPHLHLEPQLPNTTFIIDDRYLRTLYQYPFIAMTPTITCLPTVRFRARGLLLACVLLRQKPIVTPAPTSVPQQPVPGLSVGSSLSCSLPAARPPLRQIARVSSCRSLTMCAAPDVPVSRRVWPGSTDPHASDMCTC